MKAPERLTVIILVGILAMLVTGCPKNVPTTEEGPGGMPRGIVDEGEPTLETPDYPLYPGAEARARNVFETSDPIQTVRDYYVNELGKDPVVRDERGEALTFDMGDYKIILLPMVGGNGTEISFRPAEEEHELEGEHLE